MKFNKIIILIFNVITIISAQAQIPTKIDTVILKDNSIIFLDQTTDIKYEISKEKIITVLLSNSSVQTYDKRQDEHLACIEGRLPINIEFGGNVSFSYSGVNGAYETMLNIEPLFLKYFSEVFIGPILAARMYWYKDRQYELTYLDTEGHIVLGFHGGILLRESNHALLPYISAGISCVLTNDEHLHLKDGGMSIPIEIGLKNRISTSTAINYGLFYNFTRINSHNMNSFGINIGISICR